MDYNLLPLRDLIQYRLTDQEFNDLVFFCFSDVQQQLTAEMNKLQKIRLLLEYVQKKQKIEYFLDRVQELIPKIFGENPEETLAAYKTRIYGNSSLSQIRKRKNQQLNLAKKTFKSPSLLIEVVEWTKKYVGLKAWFWSLELQKQILSFERIKIIDEEQDRDKQYQNVSEKIDILIDESDKLMSKDSDDLRIELFFQSYLLKKCNHYLDWIKIREGNNFIPLCTQYDVIFRLSDRQNYRRNLINQWKRRWEKMDCLTYSIVNISSTNPSQLNQDETIGIVLNCVSNIERFFEYIDLKGIPIAIWSRKNLTTVSTINEINRILAKQTIQQDLRQLLQEIKNERETAQSGIEHIGHHICLLWDDPERMPPDEAVPEYSLSSI